MAKKNITIGGVDYTQIDKVQLKESGEDIYIEYVETSDGDAEAGDIASGKYAYVDGVKIEGTASRKLQILEEGRIYDDFDKIVAITPPYFCIDLSNSYSGDTDIKIYSSDNYSGVNEKIIFDYGIHGDGTHKGTFLVGAEVGRYYRIYCDGSNSSAKLVRYYITNPEQTNINSSSQRFSMYNNYFVYINMYSYMCLLIGTKITLADYTTKPIQDITYDDTLLVWDFDNGCFASAKPLWITSGEAVKYKLVTLEKGYTLKTVNNHRIFNLDKGLFMYPKDMIGNHTITQNGDVVKVLAVTEHEEHIEYYDIITDYHINLYADELLTSCRLSNLYLIENMKYVKDSRELHSIELFEELDNKWITGLRLLEQPLNIDQEGSSHRGKDLIEYVKRLEESKKII